MLRVRTVGDATCVYRTLTLVSRLCRDRLSLAPRLMSHVCCLVCATALSFVIRVMRVSSLVWSAAGTCYILHIRDFL